MTDIWEGNNRHCRVVIEVCCTRKSGDRDLMSREDEHLLIKRFFFKKNTNLAIGRKAPHVSSAIFQNGDHVTMVPQPLA